MAEYYFLNSTTVNDVEYVAGSVISDTDPNFQIVQAEGAVLIPVGTEWADDAVDAMSDAGVNELGRTRHVARDIMMLAAATGTALNGVASSGGGAAVNVEEFGARAGVTGTTGDVSASDPVVTNLASPVFQVGDGVVAFGAGPLTGFTTPDAPLVALGAGVNVGNQTRSYKVVAVGASLGHSAASVESTISDAPDITGVASLSVPYVVFTRAAGAIGDFNAVPTILNGYPLTLNTEFLADQEVDPTDNGVYKVTAVNGSTCTAIRSTAWENGSGIFVAAAKNTGVYVMRGLDAGRIYRITTFNTVGTGPIVFESAPYVEVRPHIVDVAIRLSANVDNLAETPKTWAFKGGSYTLAADDLVLLTEQTNPNDNGIYVVDSVGVTAVLSRAPGYGETEEGLPRGMIARSRRDTTGTSLFDFNNNGGSFWVLTTDVLTAGASPAVFEQQDIRWFAVYVQNGGVGSYTFAGAISANPYWQAPASPFPVVYRDYGGKMNVQGYGWASSSHTPVPGRLPSTAPAAEARGFHRARVTAVAGLTATLDPPPLATVVGASLRLDNWQAFKDAHDSFSALGNSEGGEVVVPEGVFQIYGDVEISRCISLRGVAKRRGTYLMFGDGFGIRVFRSGSNQPDGATLYGLHVTVENRSLPQNPKYARTNEGDPLNRAPMYGAAIHVQANFVTIDGCSTRSCGSAVVCDGRDSAGSLADFVYLHECDFSSGANGHGVIVTGANGNGCHTHKCQIDLVDGDAIHDVGFLNNVWDSYHVTIAIGFTTYSTIGSKFLNGYYEDTYGTVRIAQNATFQPMFAVRTQVHPTSIQTPSALWERGTSRSPFSVVRPDTGLLTLRFGQLSDGAPDDATVFRAVASTADSRPKIDHALTHNPVVDNGSGALTAYWKETAFSAFQWLGPNPKGSGLLLFPQGYLIRNHTGLNTVRKVTAENGYPDAVGWYQAGDVVVDLSSGISGRFEVLQWCARSEFGIATQAWSSGGSVVVGNTRSSGGKVWLVTAIADNKISGVLGTGAPSVGSDYSSQVNGEATLYQLPAEADVTGAFAAVPNPSPTWFAITNVVSNPSLNASAPFNYWSSSPTNNLTVTLSTSFAKYGHRILVRRDINHGTGVLPVVNGGPAGGNLAVLYPGTTSLIECMFDGTNWVTVGGFGLDTRVRTMADRTAVADIPADVRQGGNVAFVSALGGLYEFVEGSTAADSSGNAVITPSAGNGRWESIAGVLDLKLAIGAATADGATLWTCPAGMRFAVIGAHWEITQDWVGGSSSSIGLSSSNTKFNTKGDLLGGAAGDVAAELTVANLFAGTVGPMTGLPRTVLVAGDPIRFDRITSAFTGGLGFAHVRLQRLP